ncbi:hypothetical protein LCGC14_2402990 [marine sediment metagenome]|uniref:Uncharacterized protein n=1 Tax=marine sediment metagenome TaxID=412755 RepID=A0A0F9E732_9ZZZZ
MASFVYNAFKRATAEKEIDLADDTIKIRLVMSGTTCDTENDGIAFMGDFGTIDVADGANYAEKTLAAATVTKDDANDRAEFDADDVTYTALGVGTRASTGAVVYFFSVNDAASIPICYIDFGGDVTHDGTDFVISWDAEGILQLA